MTCNRSFNVLRTAACTVAFTLAAFANTAVAATPTTVETAANLFQNGKATGSQAMTVDAKGPVAISDAVEFPGFAFAVYDVDVTEDSVTMTLIADLAKLQITLYDDTTFDRYYFAFDTAVTSAEISGESDENFKATVEILEPGTSVTSVGAFVDGMPTEFVMENGGILVTVGEGTDLTKISENGGSLTVNF